MTGSAVAPPAGRRADGRRGHVTIGATGTPCRAAVTPWGDVTVELADGTHDTVVWHVAADDRWHVPSTSTTVRQRRIDGMPVIETRLRVPDGDAVQRVWSVPDRGGLTVIEVENDSPLPFAVAVSGAHLLTERPPADVPVRGIDLPAGTIVLPVGHRATARVAVAHDPRRRPPSLPALAPHLAVVRGWTAVVERASRLVLPDAGLVEAVAAARCDLLLDGPVADADDPSGFLFDVAELVRLGEPADAWMPEIVEPLARLARSDDPDAARVLDACESLAVSAGDPRAAGDIARMRERRRRDGRVNRGRGITALADIRRGPSAGRFVSEIERRIADGGDLLPAGIPAAWLGADFEVHAVPTGPRSAVSFAVRWHGQRPAILWEQRGDAVELRAPRLDPRWSSHDVSGEALWAAPPPPTRLGLSVEPGLR